MNKIHKRGGAGLTGFIKPIFFLQKLKMHYYELLIAFSRFKGGFQGRLCESSFHPKHFIFFTSNLEQKKIKIGIQKVGQGGSAFYEFYSQNSFFLN